VKSFSCFPSVQEYDAGNWDANQGKQYGVADESKGEAVEPTDPFSHYQQPVSRSGEGFTPGDVGGGEDGERKVVKLLGC